MLPLRDENTSSLRPLASYFFILINFAVFLLESSDTERMSASACSYGFIHSASLEEALLNSHRLLASIFPHAGWIHFLRNMPYFFTSGDDVEAALGNVNYVISYSISGVSANVMRTVFSQVKRALMNVPDVGSSGAISGVPGAYFISYPNARVITLILIPHSVTLRPLPAKRTLRFWFVLKMIPALVPIDSWSAAYWTHVGECLLVRVLLAFPQRVKAGCLRIQLTGRNSHWRNRCV